MLLETRTANLKLILAGSTLALVLGLVRCECGTATCTSSDQCADGEVCLDSKCWQACNSNADCSAGEGCRQGVCVPGWAISDAAMPDAAMPDAAMPDSSVADAQQQDAALPDGNRPDSRAPDTGTPDASMPDASALEATIVALDSSRPDLDAPDTSVPDASAPDRSEPDNSAPDTGMSGWTGYAYRRRIEISASAGLPTGYSLPITIDHQALVNDGMSDSNGHDVRVVLIRDDATEVDRVLDPRASWNTDLVRLWFSTPEPLTAQQESAYYLYYGNPAVTDGPAADPRTVFPIYEDFSLAMHPGWSLAFIGSTFGSYQTGGGVLRFTSDGPNIHSEADAFPFLYLAISGNFVAESQVVAAGGSYGTWAHLGGLMVRQSLDPDSRMAAVSPASDAVREMFVYRLADGATMAWDADGSARDLPMTVRLRRIGSRISALTDRGSGWVPLGSEAMTEDLINPVMFGIPHTCENQPQECWVEVDWLFVRTALATEPTVTLGPEEIL